jgi:hypothetical protein
MANGWSYAGLLLLSDADMPFDEDMNAKNGTTQLT